MSDIRFAWKRGAAPVLDLEALRVDPGEALFVRGPSGSGKTTLLNLVAGVLVPGQGTIHLGGRALSPLSGRQRDVLRADHVGFIFQLFNLIPYLSVVDNVLLPCRFSARRRQRALESAASLEAEAVRLLEHLEMGALVDRPVTELSVGQQQRVAAARALMGAPDLVIADEPTSALDAHLRDAFVELLFAEVRRTGAGLVFVSHDAALGTHFDRTVDMTELNRALIQR